MATIDQLRLVVGVVEELEIIELYGIYPDMNEVHIPERIFRDKFKEYEVTEMDSHRFPFRLGHTYKEVELFCLSTKGDKL